MIEVLLSIFFRWRTSQQKLFKRERKLQGYIYNSCRGFRPLGSRVIALSIKCDSLALRTKSCEEWIFSSEINCMETVVGLELMLVLSTGRLSLRHRSLSVFSSLYTQYVTHFSWTPKKERSLESGLSQSPSSELIWRETKVDLSRLSPSLGRYSSLRSLRWCYTGRFPWRFLVQHSAQCWNNVVTIRSNVATMLRIVSCYITFKKLVGRLVASLPRKQQ